MVSLVRLVINYIMLVLFTIYAVVASPIILLAYRIPFLFGILYYSQFSFLTATFLKFFDDKLRRPLFDDDLRKNPKLKILEIGPGTGANFKHYLSDDNNNHNDEGKYRIAVDILEQNPHFLRHATRSLQDYPAVRINRAIVGTIEDVKGVIPDSTYDIVIATHVLCCVRDKEAGVREILRVLKPGGKLLLYDFVLADEKGYRDVRRLQKLWTVLHQFTQFGCNAGGMDLKFLLDKVGGFDTSNLKTSGTFSWPGNVIAPLAYTVGLYGVAVKKSQKSK